MLANEHLADMESKVKFVSYTGKWPNLCTGTLTLEIDGKLVRFGLNEEYHKFWSSGGRCSIRGIEHGEWIIDVEDIPEQYRKYADEMDRVFNANVEFGCCGGCR